MVSTSHGPQRSRMAGASSGPDRASAKAGMSGAGARDATQVITRLPRAAHRHHLVGCTHPDVWGHCGQRGLHEVFDVHRSSFVVVCPALHLWWSPAACPGAGEQFCTACRIVATMSLIRDRTSECTTRLSAPRVCYIRPALTEAQKTCQAEKPQTRCIPQQVADAKADILSA
jgi:hypothetical protein